MVAPRKLGIVDRRAQLGLDLARLARLGSHERGSMSGIVPSWNRSSGWRRNWTSLTSFKRLPVRADERQVGREIIAELGGPFELGHDLPVALEESRAAGRRRPSR